MTSKQLKFRYKGYRRRKLPKWVIWISWIVLSIMFATVVASLIFTVFNAMSATLEQPTDTKPLAIHSEASCDTFKDNPDVTIPGEFTSTMFEELEGYGYPMISIDTEDIIIVAGAVSVLAENEPYDCKVAVAQVIYNRMKYYGKSVEEIIEEPNQFPDYELYYDGPDCDVCYSAAIDGLYNPPLPISVLFFRPGTYHSWKGIHDYKQFGTYYFSWSQKAYDDYNAAGYNEESPGKDIE